MVLVKILQDCAVGNEGDVKELTDETAADYIRMGLVKQQTAEKIGEPSEEGERVKDVTDYVKSGEWLTADNVQEGDELEILGDFRWDDSFETRYLTGKVAHGNEEYRFRFGKRNTERIMKEFGPDPTRWKGKIVEVVAIETYKQLGTKGLILKPVPRGES